MNTGSNPARFATPFVTYAGGVSMHSWSGAAAVCVHANNQLGDQTGRAINGRVATTAGAVTSQICSARLLRTCSTLVGRPRWRRVLGVGRLWAAVAGRRWRAKSQSATSDVRNRQPFPRPRDSGCGKSRPRDLATLTALAVVPSCSPKSAMDIVRPYRANRYPRAV